MGRVEDSIAVDVVYSAAARQMDVVALRLPQGCRVGQAIVASGLLSRHDLSPTDVACGVWGRHCGLDHLLRDGDRVELYRGLEVDPKEARRQRYKGQRKKGAVRKEQRQAGVGRSRLRRQTGRQRRLEAFD